MRSWAVAGLVLAQACVIPPDLEVEVKESEYRAICHCETCTDFDPDTMMCRPGAVVSKDTDLTECDSPSDLIHQDRVDGMEMQLMTECARMEVPGTACELAINDFVGEHASSPFLDLPFGERTCPNAAADGEPLDRIDPGTSTLYMSNAVVTSSTIRLQSPDGTGMTSARGKVQFIGGNCTTGSCPFRIVFVHLQANNFSFAGTTISNPFFMNTTIGEGTYFGGSGVFTIPSGGMQVAASGTVDGSRRGLVTTSASQGFGLLSARSRALVFAQQFVAGDITVDIQLTASIDNLTPTVSLDAAPQVECNTTGGAQVSLPATIADADGRRHTSQWYVDGTMVAVNADTLETFLPLGSHDVKVVVFDEDGGPAVATTTIDVVDTTAPTVSIGQVCLWPPNHKQYVIDASVLDVTDVCDPTPSVTFVSGSSSDPDDGAGDGNTMNDLVVKPETVCVRSERDASLGGRTYTITGSLQDDAGNVSAFTLPVNVPIKPTRDMFSTCSVLGGQPVDSSDPRCQADANVANDELLPGNDVTSANERPTTGGCTASRGQSMMFIVLLLGGMLRRKRR